MNDNIQYKPNQSQFYETVKKRIDAYFDHGNKIKYADYRFYLKVLLFISIHTLLYFSALHTNSLLLFFLFYAILGANSIFIGINIAHEAAHESISKRKWINRTFLYLFDLLGANSYMWRIRHVYSHHSYSNILNEDADLKQNPLVRIFPDDQFRTIHKYQHIYTPFLYLLYTLNWLNFRDFKDFFTKKIGSFTQTKFNWVEFTKLLLFKSVFYFYIIFIPIWLTDFSILQVILGYILMNVFASITITFAIIPSHVAVNSSFPLPNKNGEMSHSWEEHQVLTTTDFATNSKIITFLFGGFNHHLLHHLFPNISHIHCHQLTPIIAEEVKAFGLEYKHQKSVIGAYLNHYKLLKQNAKVPLK